MPSLPDARTLLVCYLRTYLVAGAFNTRGMQNIGLVFALEPGLKAIYKDPAERCRARERYQRHYQTHMFWTPLLVGVFLSLEAKIAKGLFPPQLLENVKDTTLNTLSAIGDSVFGGSLLVFWSLSTGCLAATGYTGLAVAWTALWFASLQAFKMATFLAGFREGLTFLQRLKRWNLINWGTRLKLANAALMALFLYLAWPGVLAWQGWAAAVSGLAVGSWLVRRLHLSREIIALAALAAFLCWPWLASMWSALLGG